MLATWKKSYDKPRQHIKKEGHHFANKGPYSQSFGYSSSHVWMWELDQKKRLSIDKLMCLNCSAGGESLGLQDQPVNPKRNQPWIFTGRTDAVAEAPILRLPGEKSRLIGKDPWCWERLRGGGKGDYREWDGWTASPSQPTWIWANSGKQWWTGKPCALQSMGLQSTGHDLATEKHHHTHIKHQFFIECK